MTDATVTCAPQRVNVSVIQVVSISSLPSAMGTRTRFDISRDVDAEKSREAGDGVKDRATRPGAKAKRAVITRAICLFR